ncbi:hypothetical protein RQP46_007602 [Phenoliferia psychrophenolica]
MSVKYSATVGPPGGTATPSAPVAKRVPSGPPHVEKRPLPPGWVRNFDNTTQQTTFSDSTRRIFVHPLDPEYASENVSGIWKFGSTLWDLVVGKPGWVEECERDRPEKLERERVRKEDKLKARAQRERYRIASEAEHRDEPTPQILIDGPVDNGGSTTDPAPAPGHGHQKSPSWWSALTGNHPHYPGDSVHSNLSSHSKSHAPSHSSHSPSHTSHTSHSPSYTSHSYTSSRHHDSGSYGGHDSSSHSGGYDGGGGDSGGGHHH